MVIDDNVFAGAAATPLRLMSEARRVCHAAMKYPGGVAALSRNDSVETDFMLHPIKEWNVTL
jgi:hypothetical protein